MRHLTDPEWAALTLGVWSGLLATLLLCLLGAGQVGAAPSVCDVVIGEAASEGREGMEAMVCVLKNRRWSLDGFSAARRKDLACFVQRQPQRIRALAARVVSDVQAGRVDCDSADHYCTVALYRSDRCPKWARGFRVVKIVGEHIFFDSRKKTLAWNRKDTL